MADFFQIRADWAGVSVERGTNNVPRDGKFHVLVDGQIVKSIKSEKAAMAAFREAVAATGKKPPSQQDSASPDASSAIKAELESERFYRTEMFWGRDALPKELRLRSRK